MLVEKYFKKYSLKTFFKSDIIISAYNTLGVLITKENKVTDTLCDAKNQSKVKYAAKAYVKVDGKVTYSDNSKVVLIRIKKPAYTYKVEGNGYCACLNGKLVIRDLYDAPRDSKGLTLKQLKEENAYIASYYYYYDSKNMYVYDGNAGMWEVYDKTGNQCVGIYIDEIFPNNSKYDDCIGYQASMKMWKKLKKGIASGKYENCQ